MEHSYITNSNVSEQKGLGESPSELVFTENVPGTLRCVTNGSYPAPDIQVTGLPSISFNMKGYPERNYQVNETFVDLYRDLSCTDLKVYIMNLKQ